MRFAPTLSALLVAACTVQPAVRRPTADPVVERVAARLEKDWGLRYRVTTIDQAMEAEGVPWSDAVRRAVAARLESYRPDEAAPGRKTYAWEPLIYVPTNDEKRMARWVVGQGRAATVDEAARALALPPERAGEGLRMMADLGVLAAQGDGFAPGDPERRRVGLGLGFSEVRTHGERYNVQ